MNDKFGDLQLTSFWKFPSNIIDVNCNADSIAGNHVTHFLEVDPLITLRIGMKKMKSLKKNWHHIQMGKIRI